MTDAVMQSLSYLFFALIVLFFDGFLRFLFQRHDAKKACYDCSKCLVWDCPARECAAKRLRGE